MSRYKMKCNLCEKEIENYSSQFNHFEIDEMHSIEICRNCLEKMMKWRQGIYAKLFPTKIFKKRFGETK
jgi:ribosomal protein L16/L10AE